MSSSAVATLVEGSVELYSETHSVAFAEPASEGAWFQRQESQLQAGLEALMPRVQDLVAKAEVALEGFAPIPFDATLPACDPGNGTTPDGSCSWSLETTASEEAAFTRLRVALNHYPPDRARGLFRWQLGKVAEGATAHFPKASTPWWIPVSAGSALVVGIGSFILIRRRRLRSNDE